MRDNDTDCGASNQLSAVRQPFPGAARTRGLAGGHRCQLLQSKHAGSLPRKLVGSDTLIHTRRPATWANLSETDAALLDFLRHGGKFSELGAEQTISKLMVLLSDGGRLGRLVRIADSEPPRVRAMLGALAEQHGASRTTLRHLRASLNPLSRFDFGLLRALPNDLASQGQTLAARV